jgi:hypothetical protein
VNPQIIGQAEAELTDAIAHYEEIESGLGLRLKEEARATIASCKAATPEVLDRAESAGQ